MSQKSKSSPHFLTDIWRRNTVAYLYFLPSLILMLLINLYPIVFSIGVAFTDLNLRNITGGYKFIGLTNFMTLISAYGPEISRVMSKTFLWTALNVSLQVLFGLGFALFYNSKGILGKRLHLAIVILPWAIPGYISTLIWWGMFQTEFGAINQIFRGINQFLPEFIDIGPLRIPSHLPSPNWLNTEWLAFAAYNVVNTWLAYPFMMTVILGALQGISPELYEAATIDGARFWHKVRHITLPLIRRPLLLATLLTTNTTFQQFNVIYLLNQGGPARLNETVMVWGFKTVLTGSFYGLASAFLNIVLIMVLIIGFLGLRVSRIAEEVR